MDAREAARLQTHLQQRLGNPHIRIVLPPCPGGIVEMEIAGETMGTVYRDVEDGEVSYDVHLVVLGADFD